MGYIIALGVYFCVMLSIGYYHGKKSHDIESYYLAGRSTNQFFQTMTNFATVSSSFTMMGALGYVYGHGLSFVWLGWLWTSLYTLLWLIFGSRGYLLGKKFNWMTGNDIVKDYFRFDKFQSVVAFILIMVQFPYIIAQLMAVGYLFNVFAGLPIVYGVIAGVIVLTIYAFLGGVKTVIVGDAIAGFVIMGVLVGLFVMLLPKALEQGPILEGMVAEYAGHFTFPGARGAWNPIHAITYTITFGIGYAFIPKFINRWFTPSSYKTMRMALGKSNMIVNLFTWTICPILGMLMLSLMPGVEGGLDKVPPTIVFKMVPVLGIVYGLAITAGSISTADSAMLTVSSMLLKDVYARFKKGQPSHGHMLWAGRLCTLLVGMVAMGFAVTTPYYIVMIIGMSAAMGAIVLFGFVLGPLMVPWITRSAAIWGSVLSTVFVLCSLFGVIPKTLWGLPGTTLSVFLCAALVAVISAFTQSERVSAEIQAEYHGYLDEMLTPLEELEVVEAKAA